MGRRGRRIRAVLDAQFTVIVAVLFVVALVSAGITYAAYTNQGTTTKQQPGPSATYTGEFAHNATVVRSNPVFPQGTTLSNRSVYFSRLTPRLDGAFTYRYAASDSGNVTVDGTVRLVIASVGSGRGDSSIEYWRQTRQLDQATATLAPGESLQLAFAQNVSELRNESAQLDRQMGGTPGSIKTYVVADVRTNGRVNGQQVARSQQYELGISLENGIYRVDDPGPVTNTTQQSRTVTVTTTPGPLRRLGGPVLTLLGIGGLFVLGYLRYEGTIALAESERAYLTYETARSEFDDWITRARLPPEAADGPVVEVQTLEGLVDIAIDSDRRVIEDGDGEYVVTVGGLVYRYTAPLEPGPASWSPLLGRGTTPADDTWQENGTETTESDRAAESDGDEPTAPTTGTDDIPENGE
ncbi:MAG: DUF5305 domain-containing protein [Halorientalis sp.]